MFHSIASRRLMQKNIIGNNYGMFVLGRKILLQDSPTSLHFYFQDCATNAIANDCSLEQDHIKNELLKRTRFGRIGIITDRSKATDTMHWGQKKEFNFYQPTDKRALTTPLISIFKTQVLYHMAEEGLADSVEFRRLARKFIRPAKHAQCDTLFFTEAIFGESKTKKILQHLAGTQMKVVTPDDFLKLKNCCSDAQIASEIKIHFKHEDPAFLKKRAEQILKRKLKMTDLIQTK